MNLEQYHREKERQRLQAFIPRPHCRTCDRPEKTCYCKAIKPFTPKTRFVILMHELERDRGIATGRMAHLSLKNSLLFCANSFERHDYVNQLIANPENQCFVLSPGPKAINLNKVIKTPLLLNLEIRVQLRHRSTTLRTYGNLLKMKDSNNRLLQLTKVRLWKLLESWTLLS